MGRFQTLEAMVLATAEAVRPPERLTVSGAAEKYRYLNNPGSYVGPLKMSLTPYLREPMDGLMSLDYKAAETAIVSAAIAARQSGSQSDKGRLEAAQQAYRNLNREIVRSEKALVTQERQFRDSGKELKLLERQARGPADPIVLKIPMLSGVNKYPSTSGDHYSLLDLGFSEEAIDLGLCRVRAFTSTSAKRDDLFGGEAVGSTGAGIRINAFPANLDGTIDISTTVDLLSPTTGDAVGVIDNNLGAGAHHVYSEELIVQAGSRWIGVLSENNKLLNSTSEWAIRNGTLNVTGPSVVNCRRNPVRRAGPGSVCRCRLAWRGGLV